MAYSEQEQEAFKKLFAERGFLYLNDRKKKYEFKYMSPASSPEAFLKKLGAPKCFDPLPLRSIGYDYSQGKIDHEALYDVVKDYGRDHLPDDEDSGPEVVEIGEIPGETASLRHIYEGLSAVVDVTPGSDRKPILVDPENNNCPVLDLNPDLYLIFKGISYEQLLLHPSTKTVITVFNPYNTKSMYSDVRKDGVVSNERVAHLNLYIPPKWRFVDAEPAYEGFIKLLIDHLFPVPEEREYVLDWLHYAITYRNDTVLCLVGARGTGKGLLLKDILGQLIGEKYREIVNQEILTDKFNAAFKNRRYIYFDEINVSADRELNKFKAFCNSTIALEEKGMDSKTIENFTSLALSSNDKKDFRAEPQERRFSVPEVTTIPLFEIVTEDEVADFVERIKKPDSREIASFGNWLIRRKPTYTSRKPLKGKYFFNLSRLSMPEWKLFMLDYVMNEGRAGVHIRPSEIVKRFRKTYGEDASFPVKRGSIETFLEDYLHEGECRVAYVEDSWDDTRGRDSYAIVPNKVFLEKYGKYVPDVDEEDAVDAL